VEAERVIEEALPRTLSSLTAALDLRAAPDAYP
jgi:hypothetical protein